MISNYNTEKTMKIGRKIPIFKTNIGIICMAEKEGFELLKSPTIFNQKLPDDSISAVFWDVIYHILTIVNHP